MKQLCVAAVCVQLPGAVVPGQLPAASLVFPTEPEHGKLSPGVTTQSHEMSM